MSSFLTNQIEFAVNEIIKSRNIYIVSHVQPDGDSLGSSIALAQALKKINKTATVLKADKTPDDFLFLPEIETIRDFKDGEKIDLLIAVDSSDTNRLGKNKKLVELAETVINIDHHTSNTNFGQINVVDENASATGELIYSIIEQMDISIDKDIATCIYTAISTDTGSFMYDNTSAQTHKIAGKLLDYGADKEGLNINIYQNRSLERTNLLIRVLSDLDMYFNNQVAIVKVTNEILKETGTTMEDTEGIISFVRDISSVEIAVLLKEIQEDEVKVSMRSKKTVNVSDICERFKGGGHKKAAGCTIYENIIDAEKLILNEIKKEF